MKYFVSNILETREGIVDSGIILDERKIVANSKEYDLFYGDIVYCNGRVFYCNEHNISEEGFENSVADIWDLENGIPPKDKRRYLLHIPEGVRFVPSMSHYLAYDGKIVSFVENTLSVESVEGNLLFVENQQKPYQLEGESLFEYQPQQEFQEDEDLETTIKEFIENNVIIPEKGDKGETGPQGIQGPKGDKGETGDTGPQGIQGSKGDKGERGFPGPKGETGLKGEIGPRGFTGERGDKGETGPKGDKGDTGPQGIQGSKGDKGDTGDTGPQGDKGDTGDTPTIDHLEKEVNGIIKKLTLKVNNMITQLMTFGQASSSSGGGSTKLLDNDDVEFTKLSNVDNNAILIFDNTKKKFVAVDLFQIISNIQTEVEVQYNKLIDVEGNITYIGEADPGTPESTQKWRIKRVIENSGDFAITWANGSAEFDKVWTDRLGYNYE